MEILRDEYLDYMKGRAVLRPYFVELFGPLVGLEEEWRAQGAREDEIALTAFGFDRVRRHGIEVNLGILPHFKEKILFEDKEYCIKQDQYGRRTKLCKWSATIALPETFPVRTMDDWLVYKPLYEYSEARFKPGWQERAKKAHDQGALLTIGIPGGFDEIRELMGDEEGCISYLLDPELAKDILDTIGAMAERVLDEVSRLVPVNQLSVHEDLAGKSGPLIGPNIMRDFVVPYYRRAWNVLSARGTELFQMDSDGDIGPIMKEFLDGGVNSILPFEPAAGMDMVKTRKQYGNSLALVGGLDKHVLLKDKESIRRELEYKTQSCMRSGGVLFGLDHRIPNGVRIENYRYYVKTAREMLGLDPNPAPGWARMAF